MDVPPSLKPFVVAAMATQPRSPDRAAFAWPLGPDAAQTQGRLDAVLAGHQRATSALAWELEASDRPLPAPGDLLAFHDAAGRPCALAEVVERRVVPFNEIDELFAADSGEGDLSVRYWRERHWPSFARAAQRGGHVPSESMPVVAIRFELVYPTSLGA